MRTNQAIWIKVIVKIVKAIAHAITPRFVRVNINLEKFNVGY